MQALTETYVNVDMCVAMMFWTRHALLMEYCDIQIVLIQCCVQVKFA